MRQCGKRWARGCGQPWVPITGRVSSRHVSWRLHRCSMCTRVEAAMRCALGMKDAGDLEQRLMRLVFPPFLLRTRHLHLLRRHHAAPNKSRMAHRRCARSLARSLATSIPNGISPPMQSIIALVRNIREHIHLLVSTCIFFRLVARLTNPMYSSYRMQPPTEGSLLFPPHSSFPFLCHTALPYLHACHINLSFRHPLSSHTSSSSCPM